MRQLFQDRVALTVYMERTDLEWLRATAKVKGEAVGEWARQRLLYAAEVANGKPGVAPERVRELGKKIAGQLTEFEKESGEVAGRAEQSSAASPVRPFGSVVQKTQNAPDLEESNEVREPQDVRRDRDVPAPRRRTAKAEPATRASKAATTKRTRRGAEEPGESRKCESPVGPGIPCAKCGRRH